MPSLFITGANGLIGSRLAAAVPRDAFTSIRLLVRRPPASQPVGPMAERVEFVVGDLADPDRYAPFLDEDTVVVHAAALTGAATPAAYTASNVDGTATLLEVCAARGVRRFLHLSTVAATYPDLDDYAYGRSKRDAEALVRKSPLDYTIVRPTVVADPESPAFQNLVRLASGPVLLVPGDGRACLQPIDLDDLVAILIEIARGDRFRRETLDVGGPEALDVLDLLRRIRRARRGDDGPVVHVPLGLVLPVLRALERAWPGPPPVTAGQFAVFRFDGAGGCADTLDSLDTRPRDVASMIERALGATGDEPAQPTEDVSRELRVFSEYLLGGPPDPYVARKYRQAVAADGTAPRHRFDRMLLRLALLHPVVTRGVDVWARWLDPQALVRRRLILLLAIAECWGPTYERLDRADERPAPVVLLRFAVHALASLALFAAAALVLQPVRWWMGDAARPGER